MRSPRTSKDKKAERFDYDVYEFITRLKRSTYYGSSAVAKDTCILLRTIIIKGKFTTIEDLIDTIREVGRELIQARPLELVIGNIVRRVLYIIRREFSLIQKQEKNEIRRQLQNIQNFENIENNNPNPNSGGGNTNNANNSGGTFASLLHGDTFSMSENQRKLMEMRGYGSTMQVLTLNQHSNQSISSKNQNISHLRHPQGLSKQHASLRDIRARAQSYPQSETQSPINDGSKTLQHSGFNVRANANSLSPPNKSPKSGKGVVVNTQKSQKSQKTQKSQKQNGIFPPASDNSNSNINNTNNNGGLYLDTSGPAGDDDEAIAAIADQIDRMSLNLTKQAEAKESQDLFDVIAATGGGNVGIGINGDDNDNENGGNISHSSSTSSLTSTTSSFDENGEYGDGNGMNPSLLDMFHAKDEIDYSVQFKSKFKTVFINEINFLKDEIMNVYDGIEEYSVEHIHSNETILTFGSSRTVLHFLKYASKYRAFEVFVCESAPTLTGQKMAYDLTRECKYDSNKERGIRSVTLISDSSIFAIMSRVNKVIIGTHCVLANGGLLTHSGTHQLAMAAKYHRVPVVVVTGLYKLSPLYAFDQDTFNEQGPSQSILKYNEYSKFENIVTIENPTFDYVPPDLVDLLITNNGGYSPSYIYWLLAEYYNTFDYDL